MKRIAYFLGILLMTASLNLSAQAPHPDSNGDGTDVGSTPVPGGGGGAPIGGGLLIMIGLASVYGYKKHMAKLEEE